MNSMKYGKLTELYDVLCWDEEQKVNCMIFLLRNYEKRGVSMDIYLVNQRNALATLKAGKIMFKSPEQKEHQLTSSDLCRFLSSSAWSYNKKNR